MATLPWDSSSVLALYSGAGGKEDGLIVKWDVGSKKAVRQWTLPSLNDPMGMARVPGSDALVVVDNNWALTEVQPGKLAQVTLPRESGPGESGRRRPGWSGPTRGPGTPRGVRT